MKQFLWVFVLLIVVLAGCKREPENKVSIKIEALEDVLPNVKSKQELVDFFGSHAELRYQFFGRPKYPSDSAFINQQYSRFTNPYLDTLLMETHRVFGNDQFLEAQFNEAFTNIKKNYPKFPIPKVQTIISGLETDMLVTDSLVVIGLDYYLGDGAKYRPNMYDYMLRRYNKDFIVPSVLLINGIDSRINKTNLNDRTALGDMIAYGKAYYFAKQMLPNVPDSVLIGYTSDEIKSAEENEDVVYAHLVDKEVMYSTDHIIKQRYLGERPKTLEIGVRCPGRIAIWVGWKIVNAYAAHNSGKSLPEIMEVISAEQFLKDSKYRPARK